MFKIKNVIFCIAIEKIIDFWFHLICSKGRSGPHKQFVLITTATLSFNLLILLFEIFYKYLIDQISMVPLVVRVCNKLISRTLVFGSSRPKPLFCTYYGFALTVVWMVDKTFQITLKVFSNGTKHWLGLLQRF